MATRSTSINDLLNQIHTDHQLVLPDLQREFVWSADQIRLLLDTIMRGYPFGSLLFWQTRFLEVPYREFVRDSKPATRFVTKMKAPGQPLKMVLDGQQRLQSLYVALHGSYDGKRLFFNIASGPGSDSEEIGDGISAQYRFEFRRDDDDPTRPKRLVRVADIVGWPTRSEDDCIDRAATAANLEGDERQRATRNLRTFRRMILQSDLVPVETIDEEVINKEQARTLDEILEIFVRVNSGGTRLTRSDLMFSLIKTKWTGARAAFDGLLESLGASALDLDKDFVIRGLLTISDLPPSFEVKNVEQNWDAMEPRFEDFSRALTSAIDFCRSPDVGILSASLLQPPATLHPIVYYLSRQKNGSVPDDQRKPLRTLLYFLLFNGFLRGKSPEARIRWTREVMSKNRTAGVPVDAILKVIATRQTEHSITTTAEMLNRNPRLALNIVQPTVCRATLSWQERAEVDHIFPQSVYRERFPELVDDVGNFAYLGKLRNIRKSDQPPWEYFRSTPDAELDRDYLIDRALLADEKFEEFVQKRRERIMAVVKDFLGR